MRNQNSPSLPPIKFYSVYSTTTTCPYCNKEIKTDVEESFNACACIYYCLYYILYSIFIFVIIPIAICNNDCKCSSSDCVCNCDCKKKDCNCKCCCDCDDCCGRRCDCKCCLDGTHYCPNCGTKLGKYNSCCNCCNF